MWQMSQCLVGTGVSQRSHRMTSWKLYIGFSMVRLVGHCCWRCWKVKDKYIEVVSKSGKLKRNWQSERDVLLAYLLLHDYTGIREVKKNRFCHRNWNMQRLYYLTVPFSISSNQTTITWCHYILYMMWFCLNLVSYIYYEM